MSVLNRRALLALSVSAAASPRLFAQEWAPSHPVKIIVPIIGSTNDVLARMLAPKLQEALGQPFIVENKPGAGGNIGADYVAKSAPDGQTLLVGYNGPLAINTTLFAKMPYNPMQDLAPITLAVKSAQYLVVNPQSGITSVQDLVAKAKAAPSKYSYASVAIGSASHLTMEMFKAAAKINITHVPYKGAGPAMADLLGGTVQMGFFVPGNVLQYAKDGRLKLLASSGLTRFPETPDVPTLDECGYKDFEATSWIGLLAPAGTPKNIIDRYNRVLVKILHMPDIQAKLHDMEFDVVASSPEQFTSWIRTETARWGQVIKYTGAKIN